MRKLLKWGASALRVAACRVANGGRLKVSAGRPLYLGRGARVHVAKGAVCEIGSGVYLSRGCLLQVNEGARLSVASGVFFNENVRVVVQESVEIGEDTLFGPNACVYDHDHEFDADGVHADLNSAPTFIGERCWIGANALVTKGASVAGLICIGGVRRDPSFGRSGNLRRCACEKGQVGTRKESIIGRTMWASKETSLCTSLS